MIRLRRAWARLLGTFLSTRREGELAEEIEAKEMSQRQLAAEMGRSQQAISEIVRGKKALTPETAVELELLMVKGWANRDVAAFLKISEQQVANFRFAAVKKLTEHIRLSNLPVDVFPELKRFSEE